MTIDLMPLSRPPEPSMAEAADRRIGVEIEFTSLSVHAAAQALHRRFAGKLVVEDPQAVHLVESALGDLRIELDIRHVHPHRGAANPLSVLPAALLNGLGYALAPIVPRELIVAPLDRSELPRVNAAVAALRKAGAGGEGATLFDSLGLHFNIGHAGRDPVAIVATLKAFLQLEPQLRRSGAGGALARLHATPPFPADYARRVLDAGYWPDLDGLRRDYLAANPTRKRPLDLLPLLLHLDPGGGLPRFAGKVKPRPAFHYRLPHAHVGREGWTIDADWQGWLAVERRAAEIAGSR